MVSAGGRFCVLLVEFPVQSLNCRQRHAAFVHHGNVFVIAAVQAKRGLEILRHRTELFLVRGVGLVISLADGQRGDPGKNFRGADGGEIFLGVPPSISSRRGDVKEDVCGESRIVDHAGAGVVLKII
jgi:hypothetical protein